MILKICSPQLGLDPDSDLGGEVHDYNVIKQLSQKGVKIYVYLPKFKRYEAHQNINVERAFFNHFPAMLFNLMVISYLFRTYKKTKFDVLRVHNPYFIGIGAVFFKLFHPEVKIVATHHLKEENIIFDLINRLTANIYDAIICVSPEIKEWISKRYKVDSKKVYFIPNGVSTEFKPFPKKSSLVQKYNLQNKTVLLFMGLLIQRKNPFFLIKVYEKLKKKNIKVALFFCGKGPLGQKLKHYTEKYSLKDVFFPGLVQSKKKIEYLNLCDIFVLPSHKEGMPLAALEAMSCAKPVVMPKTSYSTSIIESGEDGLLVESASPAAWAELIAKLIKSKQKFGISARKKILSSFQWEKVVEKQLEVLK